MPYRIAGDQADMESNLCEISSSLLLCRVRLELAHLPFLLKIV